MRVLLQRVSRAEVRIVGDEGHIPPGRIGRGYALLVGFRAGDEDRAADVLPWMADKVVGLRLFGDGEDKMNRTLADVGGSLLVVSQFTLYGDAKKGRRPSFIDAARPEVAEPLYDRFVELLRERGVTVETGRFGAMMDVELVNDGPVTLMLER
jgi:D-tyrosyl-tRNA(Tyr) deacylase